MASGDQAKGRDDVVFTRPGVAIKRQKLLRPAAYVMKIKRSGVNLRRKTPISTCACVFFARRRNETMRAGRIQSPRHADSNGNL
jgi:hypothetical protein